MKPWSMATADRRFADFIKSRDGECQRCGRKSNLTCSHFVRRNIFALRYDPQNCIALCLKCHRKWEDDKHGEYQSFMESRIGAAAVYHLWFLSRNAMMKKREAVERCREFLDGQYKVGGTK